MITCETPGLILLSPLLKAVGLKSPENTALLIFMHHSIWQYVRNIMQEFNILFAKIQAHGFSYTTI